MMYALAWGKNFVVGQDYSISSIQNVCQCYISCVVVWYFINFTMFTVETWSTNQQLFPALAWLYWWFDQGNIQQATFTKKKVTYNFREFPSQRTIGRFQKISIPYHGRLPYFNSPLPSEFTKCIIPPCPRISIIVNPPPHPRSDFPFFRQTHKGSLICPIIGMKIF